MDQTSRQRRYSREEIARRGDEIYEREELPLLSPVDEGKYALIDIETADYEIDRDEIAASDRLLARHPDAQVWMRQVGSRYARRFGPRVKTTGGQDALSQLADEALSEHRAGRTKRLNVDEL